MGVSYVYKVHFHHPLDSNTLCGREVYFGPGEVFYSKNPNRVTCVVCLKTLKEEYGLIHLNQLTEEPNHATTT